MLVSTNTIMAEEVSIRSKKVWIDQATAVFGVISTGSVVPPVLSIHLRRKLNPTPLYGREFEVKAVGIDGKPILLGGLPAESAIPKISTGGAENNFLQFLLPFDNDHVVQVEVTFRGETYKLDFTHETTPK